MANAPAISVNLFGLEFSDLDVLHANPDQSRTHAAGVVLEENSVVNPVMLYVQFSMTSVRPLVACSTSSAPMTSPWNIRLLRTSCGCSLRGDSPNVSWSVCCALYTRMITGILTSLSFTLWARAQRPHLDRSVIDHPGGQIWRT